MTFIQRFIKRGDISFNGMRETAKSFLPNDRVALDKLYQELKRGTEILDDEQHLNIYLRSFGKMHKAKLDDAFKCLPNIEEIFSNGIQIYDWGCGQGTATICLLDYLRDKNLLDAVTQVTLVDPSVAAVSRGADVINCYRTNIEIAKVSKPFDNLSPDDFVSTNAVKLHLFSNILDVDQFDLAQFTHLFQGVFSGENYFLCVGSCYCNNKRVDDFLVAIDPDSVFAIADFEKGEWINEWTMSMRVFYKQFFHVEHVEDIRERIKESHRKDQFFAGYILDAVEEECFDSQITEEIELLFRSLSCFDVSLFRFDVSSSVSINYNQDYDSKLAVLANMISRGLPTKAPLLLEKLFAEKFDLSTFSENRGTIQYKSNKKIDKQAVFEALHVIDPRFDMKYYDEAKLESDFEKEFVNYCFKNEDTRYLVQVLEPQRPLSTIVMLPNERFSQDQRVDFALEVPGKTSNTGFIVEVDGAPYHSNIFQRLYDERRDRVVSESGKKPRRISHLRDYDFINGWEQDSSTSNYLSILKQNSKKTLTGNWNKELQIVLSPLAVARVERVVVEAMMSGALDINAKQWDIVVVERDVPCAAMALVDIREKYDNLYRLAGSSEKLPTINLTIVSTEEFKNSPLHLDQKVVSSLNGQKCDLCIDVSVLLRDKIDVLPLEVNARAGYIIRTAHYKKRERVICTAENIKYPALIKKDSSGAYKSIIEREEILSYFLRDIFRKSSFRSGQIPVISHILADKTTIGLLPTGAGKSLTYQLSCILQPGVAIIVDPLISLMTDQVRGLREVRIDACCCVNSTMNALDKNRGLNMLQNGNVLFLLLSPERFMMENFRESLVNMTEHNHVYFSYGVIDEVHCVSEWGHDFRSSYLHLGRNMIKFMHTKSEKPLSIIGLTATASYDVLADIERELTMGSIDSELAMDADSIVHPEDDEREELTYRVIDVHAFFDILRSRNNQFVLDINNELALKKVVSDAKKQKLVELISDVPSHIQKINDVSREEPSTCYIPNFSSEGFYNTGTSKNGKYPNAGIVFCPHARGMFGVLDGKSATPNGVASYLREKCNFLKIGTFVGGDNDVNRKESMMHMRQFIDNDLNAMVATKAFGMGIDKSNIRFTVNFSHPSSIESFVQEAGRAGRDKKNAISYVLYESTEYVHFSIDKVNDIRYLMGNNDDPVWLWNYREKYVLWKDVRSLCEREHMSSNSIDKFLRIIEEKKYIQSVDKDIVLWFHNNSFKGRFKEMVILQELTYRLLNVRPSKVVEIQARLRYKVGNEDIALKVDVKKNAIKIISNLDSQKQYGYVFLDTLNPVYNYISFALDECDNITQTLIGILKTIGNYSAKELLRPISDTNNGGDNVSYGIYHLLAQDDENDCVYVIVSWENQIKQDADQFKKDICAEISKIAHKKHWSDILPDHEDAFAPVSANDFDSLLSMISECSEDPNWLIYHNDYNLYQSLGRLFYSKRDKDDTDKAIYRMCCIGLVEDVTIDYFSQTYELKIMKRTDGEFKDFMLAFFRKYYSLEKAEEKVAEIDEESGRNYLDKCLSYLTHFIYENLEKKRRRAIDDMRVACIDYVKQRNIEDADAWFKEYIHLYFNSKYARDGYTVGGMPYSLTYDVDREGNDGFEIVEKYVYVMNHDNSGSEVNNVKHLYGATRLNLRAHTDNAALCLLLCYCIAFLGTGDNEVLMREASDAYINGFVLLYDKVKNNVWKLVDKFREYISPKIHKEELEKWDNILNTGRESLVLFIHSKEFDSIAKTYLEDKPYDDK